MKKNTIITIIIILIFASIGLFLFIKKANNANNLTELDTFDKFILLVEKGEYEEAQKYTTNNFKSDLSIIKDMNISKKQKDYQLSTNNKFVYIDEYELGWYRRTTKYIFELKDTKNGWKIDKFYDEITTNQDELNALIY